MHLCTNLVDLTQNDNYDFYTETKSLLLLDIKLSSNMSFSINQGSLKKNNMAGQVLKFNPKN